MQCANCQFENMPGTASCARCGTSMTLKEQAIDVHPPRAGRWGKRLQRVRMARHHLTEGTSRALASMESRIPDIGVAPGDHFRAEIVFRCVVPGWAQFYLCRPRRGYFYFLGALTLLLLGLANFGTLQGSVALGLMFSLHAGSVADALTPPGCRLWHSIGIGVGSYLLLGMFIYAPTMWLLGRVAHPVVLERDFRPFRRGDVLLTRVLPPERGRLVIYNREPVHLTLDAHHYLYLPANGFDRILAVGGDVISSQKGILRVNGNLTTDRPLNLTTLPDFELTVPSDHVFVWPSIAPELPLASAWKEAVLLQRQYITGTVVWQTHPLTRFGPVH